MSGFMWKATVRNVNRALKEVNAFEWEGVTLQSRVVRGSMWIEETG